MKSPDPHDLIHFGLQVFRSGLFTFRLIQNCSEVDPTVNQIRYAFAVSLQPCSIPFLPLAPDLVLEQIRKIRSTSRSPDLCNRLFYSISGFLVKVKSSEDTFRPRSTRFILTYSVDPQTSKHNS